MSSEIKKHRLPGQPVGVRAHGGGSEAPGASGASLDPSQQSSIGAGIQIRLGKDPDEDRGPKYDKNDDQE